MEEFLTKKNDCNEPNNVPDQSLLQSETRKRNIREITPDNIVAGGVTKNEELLYMIRIDPKNRNMWQWICSCIKYNNMSNENWETFGELNDLKWIQRRKNCSTTAKPIPKRMILTACKKWQRKPIPNSTNCG